MNIVNLNEDRGEITKKAPLSKKKIIAAVIAVALLILIGSIVTFVLPISYISVDVNPSIEYSLNLVNNVIGMRMQNEDNYGIFDSLKSKGIKGKNVSDAISSTCDVLEENDFLPPEGAYMLISVTSGNDNTAASVIDKIYRSLSPRRDDGLELEIVKGTKSDRKVAESLSMSTGRYEMMLKANGGTLPSEKDIIESYKLMSIQEIISPESLIEEELQDEKEPDIITEEPPETGIDDELIPEPAQNTDDNSTVTPGQGSTAPSGNQGNGYPGRTGGSTGGNGHSGTGQTGNGQTDGTLPTPEETVEENTDSEDDTRDTPSDDSSDEPSESREKPADVEPEPEPPANDEPAPEAPVESDSASNEPAPEAEE